MEEIKMKEVRIGSEDLFTGVILDVKRDQVRLPDGRTSIRELIRAHIGRITKSEIMAQCPDVSQVTVQRALAELLERSEIIKIGGGRYTSYTWNREAEK